MAESNLSITPLDPVGAEVGNLPNDAISTDTRLALKDAWLEYGILLFRGVESADQHLAISRCFGELEIHPLPELRAKENPHFFPLGRGPSVAHIYDGSELKVGRIPWHRDTAFTPDICMGAMLRIVEAHTSEGETLLADTAAAYDALPDDAKVRLEGLEYVACCSNGVPDYSGPANWWETARLAHDDEYPEGVDPPGDIKWPDRFKWPPVVFPATLRHPESGRMCLFVSPMNIQYFLGMEEGESEELVTFLVRHMTDSRFVYRHHWSNNDAIIWDNRRFIHAAAGYPPTEKRIGLRTTLADKMRVGRLLDASGAEAEPADAPAM